MPPNPLTLARCERLCPEVVYERDISRIGKILAVRQLMMQDGGGARPASSMFVRADLWDRDQSPMNVQLVPPSLADQSGAAQRLFLVR